MIYKKLKGDQVNLSDLFELDPSTAIGLQKLLDFDGDVECTFSLTFQITYEAYGELHTVDLIENGGNINVTNENRIEYVNQYVNYVLNTSVSLQYDAFASGFNKVTTSCNLCTIYLT